MEPLIYICCALLVLILLVIVTLLKKYSGGSEKNGTVDNGAERPPMEAQRAAGGVRRRVPRQRMTATRTAEEDWNDSDYEDEAVDASGKKMGAKKLRKMQEKAERRAQREAEEEERKDKQRRAALLEEERKIQEAREKEEEDKLEEQRRLEREEQERREHEEYLRLKEAFTVDEEGVEDTLDGQQMDSLLQDFINYIKDMKVIMLEDLAAHFKMKTQDTIDRIQSLLAESRLTGVIDDRGKFIYITPDEYEAVARFIKQRGRVSITELAESSNRLINLNPDNMETHKRLVGEVA